MHAILSGNGRNAPKGRTPILEVTLVVSCCVNMISAVSNQGKLSFSLFHGGLTILKFIRDLQRDAGHPIVLIVDNLRIHHARIVRAWLRQRKSLIRVFYLPVYSPELNADELVNADLKTGIDQREPATTKAEQEQQMREHMEMNQNNPEKMRRLFLKDTVKYAAELAECIYLDTRAISLLRKSNELSLEFVPYGLTCGGGERRVRRAPAGKAWLWSARGWRRCPWHSACRCRSHHFGWW